MSEELDVIFQGENRQITMRDLSEMKYLERVIKESLRIYPSTPNIMRTLTNDLMLGSNRILVRNHKMTFYSAGRWLFNTSWLCSFASNLRRS